MVDTLYSILIGSMFILAIVFTWMVIVALVVATIKRMRG